MPAITLSQATIASLLLFSLLVIDVGGVVVVESQSSRGDNMGNKYRINQQDSL